MVVACEFVCEGKEGVGKEALCTHRIGKKVVAQNHACRQKGERGKGVQNPKLSCVSTSWKIPNASNNSFVFNVFQLISGGVGR